MLRLRITAFLLGLLFAPALFAQDADMMRKYLLNELATAQKAWQQRYDSLKTVADIEKYQQERKDFFRQQLGKMWERTPLNAKVVKTFSKGTSGKDAYRVEMVLFESAPGFYVTGAMFLPDETKFKAPYPAVLVVCGHSNDAKAYEPYQAAAALMATHGLAVFIMDPIDQGERSQRLKDDGKPVLQGVAAHNSLTTSSILLGRNTATFEVWDMIRALDYLESRSDVDSKRLGVTGNSGGGTQTSYIMALDDRVATAAVCCYLCGLYGKMMTTIGPQDAEQIIFGQAAFGMDHVDYCIMRAPKPTLIETTTGDFFPVEDAWATARNAKRIFDRLGYNEKMAITEADGSHGWHKTLREASARWMLRWLAGRDEMIFEADDQPSCTLEELRCTPRGEVMLLDGARSAFDLNRGYNEELLSARTKASRSDDELRATIRRITGIRKPNDIEPLGFGRSFDTPELLEKLDAVDSARYFSIPAEDEKVMLHATLFTPKTDSTEVVIYLNDSGRLADLNRINQLAKDGKMIGAIDLRGLGQTQGVGATYYDHKLFGTDGVDFYFAYLLGKSYVKMRVEDLLAISRMLANKDGVVEIVASGEIAGMVALHAGALEPGLLAKVTLDTPVRSWYDVVRAGSTPYPITNLVHGALLEYDVPDLVRLTTK
jgi:cephalosporin-C deacetylase-like acetyl esterase